MVDVKIEKQVQKKFETQYVFDEREFKGNKYVVMGKGFQKTGEEQLRVKGLWINKSDFATVAPAIVELVKEHAPEALK